MANGKYRKQHIYKLENDQGIVIGDDQLKSHITQFYKNLFGSPNASEFTLEEDRIQDIPQVTQEDNEVLTSEFTESEVKNLYSRWNTTRLQVLMASRLNSIVFWEVIKDNLMALFMDFHKEELNLFNLNFRIITLIPKVQEATRIQQYRPICVINVSFKFFY